MPEEVDLEGGPSLASVADSPDLLARALSTLKGSSEAAVEFLQGALTFLSSPPSKSGIESSLPLLDSADAATDDDAEEGEEEKQNEQQNDKDISLEQLQIIKAKTMYQMVEDIDDGKLKLLFVSFLQLYEFLLPPCLR